MTPVTTIGIDARAATEVAGGRGRVVRELLRALAVRDDDHRYVCYARTRWDGPLDERFSWRLVPAPDPFWHLRVAQSADRHCDVFLATNSYLSAILTRRPTVAIVYDLMTFDPTTSPHRGSAAIERLTLDGGVRRARRLVCISQATADDLVARAPRSAPKVSVAHLGASMPTQALAPAEREQLPPPGFVLAVGTLEPRKNLPRLVAAYAALPAEVRSAHSLVVVGALGWRTGETVSALQSLGDSCQMLGHVSDAALEELYRRSGVFCYPSLGEGFGLPVLEAMEAGAAVVTSNVSSLPEVAGDAAEYVDPLDVADISRGIDAVLRNPEHRQRLVALGRERAATFSWERFADQILRALTGAQASSVS